MPSFHGHAVDTVTISVQGNVEELDWIFRIGGIQHIDGVGIAVDYEKTLGGRIVIHDLGGAFVKCTGRVGTGHVQVDRPAEIKERVGIRRR